MRLRICVVTQGCKVNQSESGTLEEALGERGHQLVDFGEPADAVILNTCTVTHRSDRDSRALIRRAQRANPGARLIVTGCFAQVDPDALRQLGVVEVVGNEEKECIPDLIDGNRGGGGLKVAAPGPLRLQGMLRQRGRSRAYFKVQEGCEAFCAYCIVPYARGRSRSLPLEDVRAGFRRLREGGNGEVVLTGVHLGLWGRDLQPPPPFSALLDVAEEAGIPRVRLSSLEPREVTEEVLGRMARSSVLCPHLHIPLQSGSGRVLAAMGRPYSASDFVQTVEAACRSVRGICLGFDVIVGFPGEDERAFRETLGLLEELPFAYLHVFPFSPRRGTRAWDLPGRVPEPVIKERAATLRALSRAKRRAFQEEHLGRILSALPEGDGSGGLLKLTTRNYLSVTVPWLGPPPTGEQKVRLHRINGDEILGCLEAEAGEGG